MGTKKLFTKLINILKVLIKLILIQLYKLSFIYPKKSNLVLFGSMNGIRFGDNSRHLFEWVIQNKPEITAVWMTNSNEIYLLLRKLNLPVEKSLSFRGYFLVSRAKLACYTNSLKDLIFDSKALPKSIKLVALRHGRGIKKVRFAREKHKISENEKQNRILESSRILKSIACSEFQAEIQEQCLLIGREKHIVTGYPRNDYIVRNRNNCEMLWMKEFEYKKPNITILYAPTWRHGREATKFFPFNDFEKNLLVEFLDYIDGKLLLRPHVHDLSYKSLNDYLDYLCAGNSRIEMCTHKEIFDVNTILPAINILVTDWCSIEHDFILLNRPILYIPYDYDDYKLNNGFLYSYHDNLAGPIISSFQEFKTLVIESIENEGKYEDKRKKLLNKIHYYNDSSSSKRVFEKILKPNLKFI